VKTLAGTEHVAILEELGWGMAGNGYGSGDVIIGGEGCGGGEGGAEDTDVVVEGGRGAGTVVEEGKFVLRADIKGSEPLDKFAILRSLLVTPVGDGTFVKADRDATNLETICDNVGSWREAGGVGVDVGGRVGGGRLGVLVKLALGGTVAQATGSA